MAMTLTIKKRTKTDLTYTKKLGRITSHAVSVAER